MFPANAIRTATSVLLLGALILPAAAEQAKAQVAAPISGASNPVRLNGHIPPAVRSAQAISRVDGAERIPLALTLPLRNSAELDALIRRQQDPADPDFGHYLSSDEFNARFAPTQADYSAVMTYAQNAGLQIVGTHANRQVLDVAGSAAAVEGAFGTRLLQYQLSEGRQVRGPETDPVLPEAIASRISAVVGLDTAGVWRPHNVRLSQQPQAQGLGAHQIGNGPGGGLTPANIRAAYGLSGTTLSGAGQTLAVFELDGYHASDVSAYESAFGLPSVPLQNVLVNGYSGASGSGAPEVTLDIELQVALAPGASKVMVYEGPNSSSGVIDTYNRIATDNQAKSISTSWGLAEGSNSASALNAEANIFKQMAAQGQTIFAASGDSGAYDNGSTLGVDDPASQPYVTGVGGTTLATVSTGGVWKSESVWNGGSVGAGAGGGGISSFWSQPSWQSGVVSSASKGSTTMRNVPDVALDADPNTGYSIYFNGGWNIYGGTSCAAPLWSAFAALVNQSRVSNGLAVLGYLNPLLYQTAKGSGYSSDFHDIANGTTNLFYPAVSGFDDATGWGSFNGGNLLTELAGGTVNSNATLAGLSVSPGTVTSGGAATGTVAMSAAVTSATAITLTSSNASAASVPASVTVAAGSSSATFTVTAGTVSSSTAATITATYNGASVTASVTVNPAASTGSASASFVKTDSSTNGNWKGVYGASGYSIAADGYSIPAFATLSLSGAAPFTWATNATDARGLQSVLNSGRLEACWYTGSSMTYDLNLTDGASHQVGFYCLDYEPFGRAQRFDITDASTGALLSSQSASSFGATGKYLIWSIKGHVKITVTNLGGVNAVVSGIFFDGGSGGSPAPTLSSVAVSPSSVTSGGAVTGTVTLSAAATAATTVSLASSNASAASVPASVTVAAGSSSATFTVTAGTVSSSTAATITATYNGASVTASVTVNPAASTGSASASFVKTDSSTNGNWKGVYGASGYSIAADGYSIPAFATLSLSGAAPFTWATNATDARGLQSVLNSGRLEACWYTGSSMTYDLNLTDGASHQVGFYCLDYEPFGRAQRFDITDASTGALLSSQSASSFGATGKYLIWSIKGHVKITVTNLGGVNAVVSGIFFD